MTKPKKPPRKYEALKSDDDDASTRKRVDVHEAITAKIVAAIEAGAGEFQMPWHRPGVAFTLPKNALTEKTYRGSNILSLWIDADAKKFEHQTWATFKQWQELGAQVRKGEKGSLIVKYGEWVPKQTSTADAKPDNGSDDDAGGKRLFATAAWVFNAQQVDGYAIAPAVPRADLTVRLDHVNAFIAATGAEFREGGQRAFYRHRDSRGEGDFIQMPPRNLFTGTATSTPTESFESTRLHELSHWSGAGHRLKREFGEKFGDKAYSFGISCRIIRSVSLRRIGNHQYTSRRSRAIYCKLARSSQGRHQGDILRRITGNPRRRISQRLAARRQGNCRTRAER